MAMLWSQKRLLEAVENLHQFLGSAPLESFGLKLEDALERACLDEGDVQELLAARDVLVELVRGGRRLDEVARVAVTGGMTKVVYGRPAVGLPFAR
jgi:hypothetical protein